MDSYLDSLFPKNEDILQSADYSNIWKQMSNITLNFNAELNKKNVKQFWFLDTYKPIYNIYDILNTPKYNVESLNSLSSKQVVEAKPLSDDEFQNRYRDSFKQTIKSTAFISGEENVATIEFCNLLSENKNATLTLIQEYFINAISSDIIDENLVIKILILLGDYEYEALFPFSQAIAICAYNLQSANIISATFNLFGHWGNQEALNMLNKYEEPKELWLKIKYRQLIQSISKRCSMQEK